MYRVFRNASAVFGFFDKRNLILKQWMQGIAGKGPEPVDVLTPINNDKAKCWSF
jgi:hypothetical protein